MSSWIACATRRRRLSVLGKEVELTVGPSHLIIYSAHICAVCSRLTGHARLSVVAMMRWEEEWLAVPLRDCERRVATRWQTV
jgi:hypothetical protein